MPLYEGEVSLAEIISKSNLLKRASRPPKDFIVDWTPPSKARRQLLPVTSTHTRASAHLFRGQQAVSFNACAPTPHPNTKESPNSHPVQPQPTSIPTYTPLPRPLAQAALKNATESLANIRKLTSPVFFSTDRNGRVVQGLGPLPPLHATGTTEWGEVRETRGSGGVKGGEAGE